MAGKNWWEEDPQQYREQRNTSQNAGVNNSGNWWDSGAVANTVGNDIANRVNTWFKNHNNYLSNYHSRYGERKYTYEDSYVGDSSDWLDTISKQKNNFDAEADNIFSYIDHYKGYLDADWVDSIRSMMNEARNAQSNILKAVTADRDYWAQFDSKDVYNSYVIQQKDYEDKKNFDLEAGQKEIEYLERVYNEYDILNRTMIDEQGETRLQELRNQYGYTYDLKRLISEKKAYLNQVKHIQEGITLSSVSGNEDFEANSGYVSTEYGEGFLWDKLLNNDYGLGYKDLTYEYINNQNGIREEIERQASIYGKESGDGESLFEEKGYDLLEKDEVAIYNYYYAKDGKEAAEKYLDSIQETLNQRKATGMYKQMKDKTALELAFGVIAGLDQFESGVKNLFNSEDDYVPQSAYQMASGMVREDLADKSIPMWYNFADGKWEDKVFGNSLGQVGYDTITTTANMAPSVLTSIAANMIVPGSGAYVGNAMMFASSAGNAYQEALNLGYDKGQARAYSTLVGASEAGLQYLLGGISSLGGKVSGNALSKMLNGVDKAFARTAIKLGGNMLSEGIEEGLQEVLTPWFKNLTLHTNEDINWSEVAYSSLLGALTAGFMEGPSTISGELNTYKTGKTLQAAGISAKRLANLGKTFSADTVAYQLAGRVDGNTGAYTLGRLFNEIGATLSGQNMTEITNALVAKGMDKETARKNAEVLAYVVEGGQLTKGQVAVIEANDVLAEVVRTTLIDANTTWNQRTKAYNETLNDLAQKLESGKQTANTAAAQQAQAQAENTATVDNVTITEKTAPEGGYEVSAEGETILKESGERVRIKAIASKVGNRITLELESGEIVDADKVNLSEEEALVHKAISEMDISAKEANKLLQGYDGSISAEVYASGIVEAYNYGRQGMAYKSIDSQGYAVAIPVQERIMAYQMGRKALETEKTGSYNNTTSEKERVIDGTGESVHLRRGAQWTDSESPDRSVRGMAETPGGVQKRNEAGRSKSNGADSQAYEGRVNAGDLGIPGGTGARNLTAVSSDYSADTKEAEATAAEQGLEAVFYTGNNLRINHDGKVIEARACIVGKKIYVRADHPHLTATQLTKHELAHDKIDMGEIVTKNVYDMMVAYYGEAKVKDIIQAYAEAYDMGYDTQKAADAVFVEIVCDSEAGINYFTMEEKAGTPHFMENVGIATQADMNSRDSRGPPADGVTHFSRETERFFQHFTGAIKTDEYIWLSNVEAATIKSNIKSRATYLNQDASRGLVWAHSAKKEYAYVFNCNSDYSVTVTDILDAESDIAIINAMTERMENYGRTVTRIQRNSGTNGQQRNGNQRSNAGSSSNAQTSQSQGTKGMVSQASQSNQQGSVGTGNQNSTNSGADKTRNAQKVKFSREATETIINQSMTMQQAKDMVQRAFVTGQIKEFYDGQYRNGDEWLAGEGVDEVALYIENEYAIVNKYLNHIQEYIDDDIMLQDILNAYLGKTLTGKVKQPTQWMDLSHDVAVADKRFYAPKAVKDANAKLEVAKQRITNSNREEVTKARAEILLYAHNKGAAETLGLTEAELNRMLRSWSGYRSEARDISRRINSGVALSNRWSGIENCSWLSKAQVSKDELARLVKSVDGDSQGFERNYIARTMLALDTHIDWSDIKFIFTGVVDPNRRSVRGAYNHREKTIKANYSSPDTVAHEMGHALDHKWANELGFGDNVTMTEGRLNKKLIKSEKARIWYDHFQEFIQDLTDSADISSSYTMDNGEVFARFVSTFVQWTDQTATGKQNYGYISSGRSDKFTANQYITFVKLLQEKAMLDSEALATENQDVKFSREFSLSDLNRQINELTNKRKEILASAEYDRIVGKISTATGEALDAVIQEYNEFTESSGLYDVTKQLATLEEQAEKTRKQQEADYLSKADAERKAAIEASGLTEAEYDTKQAVKEFGYTPYYYDAGYIVANGKLLNFSGEKGRHFGSRGQDHRAIGIIYDDLSGTQAMVKFMNEGNIRIMDESPGLDISTMPTKEQMATIKKYVASKHGEIYLDISDKNGNNVASIEYDRGTSPSIVELDIKEYFEKGKIPTKFEPKFSREFIQAQMTEQEKHLQQVNKALEKDNAKLQEDNQYLKQLLKLQKEVTGGTKFTRSSVEAMARQLKTKANASGDTKELAIILNNFYEFVATSKELSWEDVMEQAEVAADWLVDNKRDNFVRDEYAQRVLDDLLGSSFYLNNEQKGEAAYVYGSYQAFRQKVFGIVTASDKANMSLDELWKTMSAEHPYYFPAETNSGGQVQGIVDVINTLRSAKATDSDVMYDSSKEMEKRKLLHDVYDSFWRVSTLRTVADSKQKEINRLKSMHYTKMDQVKQAHKEATKQLEAEYRQRMDALRVEYKARTEEKIRKVKDANRKSRQIALENRHKTAMRHKIQKVVKELNDLLLNESKKRHVPDSLKKAVADALDLVNMDTVGAEERAAKYANLIAKEQAKTEPDQDKIDAYTVTMENVLRQGEKMGQRLKELHDAYEEISESDDPDIANAYDPVIAGAIKELSQTIGNTSIRNMTLDQLSDVYDMYRMVLTRVRDANKTLQENIKESISNLASRVVGEVKMTGGEHTHRAVVLDPVRKFLWNNLKPVYAMEHMGSDTLTEVFNNVRAGEDTWAKDVVEAREFYLDKSKKYGYDSWDFDKKYHFESASGIKFELTLEQILSLYAYSKREQAHDHLRLGGFVFDSSIETYKEKDNKSGKSILKYFVNTADAHQITPEILGDITGRLTKEQMGFVDDMQEYLSTVMGTKGNEVTSKMYGVKLFKEKFYFPLKSAKQFMFEQNEVSGEVKIKNSGFTNKVVAKANNPVILSNFMDVWAGHVNDMSMYHAFTLPLEDFNRVFNYNIPKKEGQPPVSVKGTIQSAYSPAALSYVKQLITDLNGGAVTDPRESTSKALMAKFKKASVFASMSVVVQQPSAVGRAFALIDPKYFIGRRVDAKRHKLLWAELKKYAPVAVIKEMGYFDTNMGRSAKDFIAAQEYGSLKEKAKAIVKDSGFRDEVLSTLPALADEMTWCWIWEAVKREMHAKHPSLDVHSDVFLQAAGQRFTEVITKTQVYDSVLSRSANMRSKGGLMNMLTAFAAEPTTAINMIEDAVVQLRKGNKAYAKRTLASVFTSVFLNSLLVSLVYAMRDDDEDETFVEKYLSSFASEMVDGVNPITYYPVLRDVWSVLQGYDIERTDMALVTDMVDSLKRIVQLSEKDTSTMSDEALDQHEKKLRNAWLSLMDTVFSFTGLPVKNIRRDYEAGVNLVKTIRGDRGGRSTTWNSLIDNLSASVKETVPVWGWKADDSKADKLYRAITKGDAAYRERLMASYGSDTALHSAIRTGLRNNDPRIREAAIAWNSGENATYMRIAKEILKEKHFVQDDVVLAIRAEADALKKDRSSSTNATSNELTSFFTMDTYLDAVMENDREDADIIKMDMIQTAVANGDSQEEAEKDFSSSFVTKCGKAYQDGELTSREAVTLLEKYSDLDQEEADEKVQYWVFKEEYPAYDDMSQSAVTKYYDIAEPAGIGIDTYYSFLTEASKCTGEQDADGKTISGSVKAEKLELIDALPLTRKQKDALYLAEGWAESKLYEAPWH